MTDRQDIEALERWFAGFPDPQPSAECLERIKTRLAADVSDSAAGAARATPQCKQRLKLAVREALRHKAADTPSPRAAHRPVAFLAWSGVALAAAAALALMWTTPRIDAPNHDAVVTGPLGAVDTIPGIASDASPDETGEDAEDDIELVSIFDDPEASGLADQLADLELRTAALDYYGEASVDRDWETLQVIEDLMRPNYLLATDELESGV